MANKTDLINAMQKVIDEYKKLPDDVEVKTNNGWHYSYEHAKEVVDIVSEWCDVLNTRHSKYCAITVEYALTESNYYKEDYVILKNKKRNGFPIFAPSWDKKKPVPVPMNIAGTYLGGVRDTLDYLKKRGIY